MKTRKNTRTISVSQYSTSSKRDAQCKGSISRPEGLKQTLMLSGALPANWCSLHATPRHATPRHATQVDILTVLDARNSTKKCSSVYNKHYGIVEVEIHSNDYFFSSETIP
jgi:hypothetical protein